MPTRSEHSDPGLAQQLELVLGHVRRTLVHEGVLAPSVEVMRPQDLYDKALLATTIARVTVQAAVAVHQAYTQLVGTEARVATAYEAFVAAAQDVVRLECDERLTGHIAASLSTGMMMTGPRETYEVRARELVDGEVAQPFNVDAVTREVQRAARRAQLIRQSLPSHLRALETQHLGLENVFCYELYVTPCESRSDWDGLPFLRRPEWWYGFAVPDRRKYLRLEDIAVIAGLLEAAKPTGMSVYRWQAKTTAAIARVTKRIKRVEAQAVLVRTPGALELVRSPRTKGSPQ